MRRLIKNTKAFTTMEMIVAIALFSVTMIMATELFQKIYEGQRNNLAAQNVQESLRYAQEVVSKEVRMAKKTSSGECAAAASYIYDDTDGSKLKFKNMQDQCIVYELDNNRLKITRDADSGYITPSGVKITGLQFIANEINQPFVTYLLDAEYNTPKAADKSRIKIQTTISSRHYE